MDAYEPEVQGEHTVAPAKEKVPTAQSVWLLVEQLLPASQVVQDCVPVIEENLPGEQGDGVLKPATQKKPIGQMVNVELPKGQKLPAEH